VFFDTPIYIVFLTLVVLAYWRLRWRQQNILLLLASYLFYGWWDPRFLGLIALSTVVDFYCAKVIAASADSRRRKAALIFSLVINLGFLATPSDPDRSPDNPAPTRDKFLYIPGSRLHRRRLQEETAAG
jgi:D-alanyl-lipoteichoic acid acyltransferase DltB (MBOAT superfamily)